MLEVAFYGFPCIGLFGASTLAAFAADVVQVATLHLHMCYIITTTVVYGLRLSTSTLWNLFQGTVASLWNGYITYALVREVLQQIVQSE